MKNFKYYKTLISLLGAGALTLTSCSNISENNIKNMEITKEELTNKDLTNEKNELEVIISEIDDNKYSIKTTLEIRGNSFNNDAYNNLNKEYELENLETFIDLIQKEYNAKVIKISLFGNINLDFLNDISCSDSLETLCIYDNSLSDVKSLSKFKELNYLSFSNCSNIINLNDLNNLENLEKIFIDNCEHLSDISQLSDIDISIVNSGFVKIKN